MIQTGTKGPEVGNWQRFLNEAGASLDVDEDFGPLTKDATETWQATKGLLSSGIVDNTTLSQALMDGYIPFVQAKNYTALWPSHRTSIDLIVIHTMESPDKPTTAPDVAAWFAGPNAPQASAHYCCDETHVVQTVRDTDVAWHAPGANRTGIGIEHAGYAKQTADDWRSPYNQRMLALSAKLAAKIALRWNIPVVHLTVSELKASKPSAPARGFIGHVDATNTFGGGTHWDPGPGFPYDNYLALVRMEMS